MNKNIEFKDCYNAIGENIKNLRKLNKITQEDLCARMQVMGFQISRTDISKLENKKRMISDIEIIGFAKALKVNILDLFKDII